MKCLFCENEIEITDQKMNNVVCACKAVNIVWIDGTHCAVRPREEGEEMYMDISATGVFAELARRWLKQNINRYLEQYLEEKEIEEKTPNP